MPAAKPPETTPILCLATAFYWENLFGMGLVARGDDGVLAITLPIGDARLPGIAAKDIGLTAYGARLRVEGDPDGVEFDPHPDTLGQLAIMTLITEHGPLDLCFTPAGFPEGYPSLSEHASTIVVGAVDLPVASLEDVVASKRAAGRPKDIVALPPLEARLRRG